MVGHILILMLDIEILITCIWNSQWIKCEKKPHNDNVSTTLNCDCDYFYCVKNNILCTLLGERRLAY